MTWNPIDVIHTTHADRNRYIGPRQSKKRDTGYPIESSSLVCLYLTRITCNEKMAKCPKEWYQFRKSQIIDEQWEAKKSVKWPHKNKISRSNSGTHLDLCLRGNAETSPQSKTPPSWVRCPRSIFTPAVVGGQVSFPYVTLPAPGPLGSGF